MLTLLALLVAVILWIGSSAPATAGPPPNRLNDNRGNAGLASAVSAALSAFISPLIGQPVVVSGRVLSHPSIHNLYWDDNWDAHNTGSAGPAPTVAAIDGFTKQLAASHYFDSASQYGVGSASFSGSHGSSVLCAQRRPPSTVSFVSILLWVSCEAGLAQSLVPCPPIGSPCLFQGLPAATGVPSPDDNSLYVVYLPPTVNISDFGKSTCSDFGAYHFTSYLPETKFFGPFPFPSTQSFAFAVVPTVCGTSMDALTQLASHEIIEASTDPVFGLGWVDNSTFDVTNLNRFATTGEAADICDLVVSTPPLTLSNGISVVTYWSNKDNACVPLAPSASLSIGSPSVTLGATTFVSKATDIKITASPPAGATGDSVVVHIRFSRVGTPQPTFTTCTPNPCIVHLNANDGADGPYSVEFFAEDTTSGITGTNDFKNLVLDNTPPHSTLNIGLPRYPLAAPQPFVTSATPFTVQASDTGSGVASISYRFFPLGTTPPTYTTVSGKSTTFTISGADGVYEIDTFATDQLGNAESSHIQMVTLDNTAPVITIAQPAATNYVHSATLTLTFSVSDGTGSGVNHSTVTLDGSTTVAGQALVNGLSINLLTELGLGSHTFSITAVDNLGNTDTRSVTFTIIVTPQSIMADVHEFLSSGDIKNAGLANSLLAKLQAAAQAESRGNCMAASNIYRAFISQVQAQTGKGIGPPAAGILIADARYLIAQSLAC